VLFYVVLRPDKTPLQTPFLEMGRAQQAIRDEEPDPIAQSKYQIHPISQLSDLRLLNVKPCEKVILEKFDGEYVGQPPVEVVEV
jgi:hypothetical protein